MVVGYLRQLIEIIFHNGMFKAWLSQAVVIISSGDMVEGDLVVPSILGSTSRCRCRLVCNLRVALVSLSFLQFTVSDGIRRTKVGGVVSDTAVMPVHEAGV